MWKKVVIEAGNGIEQVQGGSLMTDKGGYEPAWRAAGLPMDSKVYAGTDADGNHVFYFNKPDCEIGKDVLARFDAVECDEPNLEGLKLIK